MRTWSWTPVNPRSLDLNDGSLTENTRASYPLHFIPNASSTGTGPHPKNIVMLTADAFGVLPPISKLTPDQAMYHFLSGYTARVAGTEKGVKEPQATFSTCFGGPFMPRHPTVYAKLLGEMMSRHGADCWLVNTGWSGGGYGVGNRMKIAYTRAMIHAALDGVLAKGEFRADPNFGLLVPVACPGVPPDVLQPKATWGDKKAYDVAAQDVARRFEKNFEQFKGHVDSKVNAAGDPRCRLRSISAFNCAGEGLGASSRRVPFFGLAGRQLRQFDLRADVGEAAVNAARDRRAEMLLGFGG